MRVHLIRKNSLPEGLPLEYPFKAYHHITVLWSGLRLTFHMILLECALYSRVGPLSPEQTPLFLGGVVRKSMTLIWIGLVTLWCWQENLTCFEVFVYTHACGYPISELSFHVVNKQFSSISIETFCAEGEDERENEWQGEEEEEGDDE